MYGIGAFFSLKLADGSERSIGLVSWILLQVELKYSKIEKEGLACVFEVKIFHSYLYGYPSTLVSNHKPLLTLLNSEKAIPAHASAHIQWWALTLVCMYTMQFKYTTAYWNANAMSWLSKGYQTYFNSSAHWNDLIKQLNSSLVTADCVCSLTGKAHSCLVLCCSLRVDGLRKLRKKNWRCISAGDGNK